MDEKALILVGAGSLGFLMFLALAIYLTYRFERQQTKKIAEARARYDKAKGY